MASHRETSITRSVAALSRADTEPIGHNAEGYDWAVESKTWFEEGSGASRLLYHYASAVCFQNYAAISPARMLRAALFVNSNGVDASRVENMQRGIGSILVENQPRSVRPDWKDELTAPFALAGFLALCAGTVQLLRSTVPRVTFTAIAIDAAVLTAVYRGAFERMGGNVLVGWLYAPDVTLLSALIMLLATIGITIGAIKLLRSHRR